MLALLWLPVHVATGNYTAVEKQQLADQATHILGGNANVISRWSNEIKLAVVGGEHPAFVEQAAELVNDIATQIGLSYREINIAELNAQGYNEKLSNGEKYDFSLCDEDDNEVCANLVVVQSTVDEVRQMADAIPLRDVYKRSLTEGKNPYCFFAPFIDGSMNIRQAFVFVRADLDPAMTRTCLQEEIYQSFGLFNDASGSTWFSFNNRVEPKDITPMDKRLLRCLYSPDFRPGVPAFVVVKKFIASLEQNEAEACY